MWRRAPEYQFIRHRSHRACGKRRAQEWLRAQLDEARSGSRRPSQTGGWVGAQGAFALDLRLDVATRPTKDIDLGRDDSVDAAIEDIIAAQQLDLSDFSDLLSFAEIEPVELPAMPLAQHVAGRCTPTRAATARHSGPARGPKDLVDILLIASAETMDAAALRESLKRTFELRAWQPLPDAFPTPPADWSVHLRTDTGHCGSAAAAGKAQGLKPFG